METGIEGTIQGQFRSLGVAGLYNDSEGVNLMHAHLANGCV